MKLIRAVKRTKLARQILRAPIILIAVILSALLGLSSCGGGESLVKNPRIPIIPPGVSYGAIVAEISPAGKNSCGFAAGIATGYSSQAAARSAAKAKCRQAGGRDCDENSESVSVTGFGSGYRGDNACAALVYGSSARSCFLTLKENATRKAAEAEAIAACEADEFSRNKGLDCTRRVISDCSTSGQASSYSSSQSGSSNGSNGDTGNGNGNSGGSSTVRASITDRCNDGRAINYRFFHVRDYRDGGYQSNSLAGSWPGGNEVYVARQFGETYTSNLSCKPGYGVCYGARPADRNARNYWGVGIDGDKECETCCVTCPTSGTVPLSKSLTCSR